MLQNKGKVTKGTPCKKKLTPFVFGEIDIS